MSTFSEKTAAAKKSAKRFFRRLIILLVLAGIAVVMFLSYATLSEGSRAGVVLKVSKKGTVFKTYEGQLDLMALGASHSSNQFSEIFDFSIPKDRHDIYDKLERASLTGERVLVKYKEKYVVLPWRGDTDYFIYDVETSPNAPVKGDGGLLD